MTKPVDGVMDPSAAYVALSRATSFESLFLVEPITLADLQHELDINVVATLDFLDRLDTATEKTFLKDPSTFHPVSVRAVAGRYIPGGHRNTTTGEDDAGGQPSAGAPLGGLGPAGTGVDDRPAAETFLVPNSRSNCFHNAAIACSLAAFDGQSLPLPSSCTPSAKVFFDAVQAVRLNMNTGNALPDDLLVSAPSVPLAHTTYIHFTNLCVRT